MSQDLIYDYHRLSQQFQELSKMNQYYKELLGKKDKTISEIQKNLFALKNSQTTLLNQKDNQENYQRLYYDLSEELKKMEELKELKRKNEALIDQLKIDLGHANDKISQLKMSSNSKKIDIKKLESKVKKIKELKEKSLKYDELESKYVTQVNELQNQLRNVSGKNALLRTNLSECQLELHNLKSKSSNKVDSKTQDLIDSKNVQIKSLNEIIRFNEKKIGDYQLKLDELNDLLEDKDSQLSKLQDEQESISEVISLLESKNLKLSSENKEILQNLNKKDEMVKETIDSINNLNEMINQKDQVIRNLQGVINQTILEKNNNNVRKEIEELNKLLEKYKTSNEDLINTLEKTTDELSSYKSQFDALEVDYNDLYAQCKNQNNAYNQLNDELYNKEHECDQLNKEKEDLEKRIEYLIGENNKLSKNQNQLEILTNKYNNMILKNKGLISNITELTNEVDNLKEEKYDLDQANKLLNKQIDDLESIIENKENYISHMVDRCDDLESQKEFLENDYKIKEKDLNQKIDRQKEDIEDYQDQLSLLKVEYTKAFAERNAEYTQEIHSLNQRLQQHRLSEEKTLENYESLSNSYNDLKTKFDNLNSVLEKTQCELGHYSDSNEYLSESFHNLTKVNMLNKEEIINLSDTVKSLNKKIRSLEVELSVRKVPENSKKVLKELLDNTPVVPSIDDPENIEWEVIESDDQFLSLLNDSKTNNENEELISVM